MYMCGFLIAFEFLLSFVSVDQNWYGTRFHDPTRLTTIDPRGHTSGYVDQVVVNYCPISKHTPLWNNVGDDELHINWTGL